MGPPGRPPEDARLEALLAHRRASQVEPHEPDRERGSVVPLALSQILDLMTTENVLRQPTPPGWDRPRELNPIPGMGSSIGRVGLNTLEAALVAALLRKAPKLGKKVRNSLTIMHTGAALGNQRNADQGREDLRVRAIMGK